MKLRGTMKKNEEDLLIGDLSMTFLKEQYGSPLYILDQEFLEETCQTFIKYFKSKQFKTEVAYASKALLNIPLAQLLDQEGLYFDVASQGEIFVLHQANVPMSHLYFHGNNKSMEELKYAVKMGVGVIVLDNHQEFKNLKVVLESTQHKQAVMLRINPGIETDTHQYIQTSSSTSKFGESIHDQRTKELIANILEFQYTDLKGFHSHIGSQIFEKQSFFDATHAVLDFYETIEGTFNCAFEALNLGGGFGVYYSKDDRPFALETFLTEYIEVIETELNQRKLNIKEVIIEPGRSIINDSISTLYTVGSTKETIGKINYMFVDGGMSDNIRPALYQANYEAIVLNSHQEKDIFSVAGKLCESGDILIEEIELNKANKDDLLLIPATGAYTYSMSSNYNKALRPAIVSVKKGEHRLFVRRETLNDLVERDISL